MSYSGTWEEQQAQYRTALADYEAKRDGAMAEAGVALGDEVEYHAIPTCVLGTGEHFRGTVYLTKNGKPRVKLVTGGWKPWHKGWKKASA